MIYSTDFSMYLILSGSDPIVYKAVPLVLTDKDLLFTLSSLRIQNCNSR